MATDFKVGDYIIDFAYIYEITSINLDDKYGKMIHYKPVKGTDKVFTASIPEKNLGKSGLRKLLTPNQIEEVLEKLKEEVLDYEYSSQIMKEEVYLNLPSRIITPLKHLWKKGTGVPRADQELKDEIIKHLCLEIAFVTETSGNLIRSNIEKNLNQ